MTARAPVEATRGPAIGDPLKLVISSAGPKAHYVQWFRNALDRLGLSGEVIAMEYRDRSPSFAVADRAVPMPAYNALDYPSAMREWVAREKPHLFISLNDYEIQVLATGLADELRALGCAVFGMSESTYGVIQDKKRTAKELAGIGVATPRTYLGTEGGRLARENPSDRQYVVKHRYGCGSAGLRLVDAGGLQAAIEESARTALLPHGRPGLGGLDGVVVQERLPGPEYGVDGVFTVDGTARMLGVLARRKIQMLDGNTYIAITVESTPFRDIVQRIGALLLPRGQIDIDMMMSEDGVPHVIDINARMGGGYPFVHAAGADSPTALLRSLVGLEEDPTLLDYKVGVATARMEQFVVVPNGDSGRP